jgi:hypothetical protein
VSRRLAWQAALTSILVAACAGSTVKAGGDNTPAPENGDSNAPAPGVKPSGLVYRPTPATGYKLERHDSLSLQYPGGAVQQQVRDRVAFVHVTIEGTSGAASFPVTIVLDSLRALENGQPIDSAIVVRGAKWTGTLGIDGTLSQLQADKAATLTDELSGRLRLLFPRLPALGAREGMEWADSSEYKLVADGFPSTEQQRTTYRASEGPKKGLTLTSDGTYSRTGSRQQADQVLEMTGTGNRHAVHQISGDGALVSAQGNDSGDMTISVPAVGQNVPVKQTGSFSITQSPAR